MRRNRLRRGSGFFVFTIVVMPIIMLAGVVSVDVVNLIMARRQVTNAVDAAAVGGAHDFLYNDWAINRGPARGTVQEMMDIAVRTGAVSSASLNGPAIVEFGLTNSGRDSITVTQDYTVSYNAFTRLLGVLIDIDTSKTSMSVSRTAFVCASGNLYDPTDGYCVRPVQSN